MQPLPLNRLFDVLDLEKPELAPVRASVAASRPEEAAGRLLEQFRSVPLSPIVDSSHPLHQPATEQDFERANDAMRHIFQWGPYPAYDYGSDIDWDADPREDLEWRGRMHRMDLWVGEMARAYRSTGDEKYAKSWIDLTADWVRKFAVDETHLAHRDIQFAARSSLWCAAFGIFVHSPAMTPDFLRLFLAAVYDGAHRVILHPRTSRMAKQHANNNKALMEAKGLLDIAVTFTQFRDAEAWLQRSLEIVDATLRVQILDDGVQHEFTPGYHVGCTKLLTNMAQLAEQVGSSVPCSFHETLERMADFVLGMTSPDRAIPMFGDSRRPEEGHTHTAFLRELTGLLDRPEFAAVADNRLEGLPSPNWCFPHGGMYFLRSGWSEEDIYMALHCCPKSYEGRKGGHDQPDNGTFELRAFGRWVMPDSGSFIYHESKDPIDRFWFRQTAVHQTLTMNLENSVNAPRHLFWWNTPDLAAVTFENQSYPLLCHRRTVFFVQRRFYLFVDEVLGTAEGDIDLHFQLAPGPAVIDPETNTARTDFAEGGNVLVRTFSNQSILLEEEAGYTSYRYGTYEPRPAFRFRLAGSVPAAFLSVVIPYCNREIPAASASFSPHFVPGSEELAIRCTVDDMDLTVGSDREKAWIAS